MKKSVSRFVPLLILCSFLVTLPKINIVKASETIYIRPDGSVEGTDKIQREGNVYTFTGNIYDSIVVERDNIVVDGAGYTLQGAGTFPSTGIDLSYRSKVTIKNVEVKAFSWGIQLDSSSNNIISGNKMTNNWQGVLLFESSNNMFRNNDFSNNEYSFGVSSYRSSLLHFIQDIDESNTVNGKPVYYWVNRRDMAVPLDAGWIALVNCRRITVKKLNFSNNVHGVLLAYTTDSIITKNKLTNNLDGIFLEYSSNNTVNENNITNNGCGILLDSSNYNNISGNIITKTRSGIFLGGIHNIISGNYIINNREEGIFIQGSSNQIIGNYIANNGNGTYFFSPPFGAASSNNLIYHNSYVNNARQIYIEKGFAMPDSINIWDNGVEGNYWRNYFGVDNNGDGIGDTPYFIDENNQDNYPLMNNRIPPLETTPPTISIASPENKTYTVNHVSLTFTVSELTSWMGYSIDRQTTNTIAGNTTLTGLSDGMHNLTVYASDLFGNTGTSETIHFSIAQPSEPFPTSWIVATTVIIAVVGAALLVYFGKIRKTTGEIKEQDLRE